MAESDPFCQRVLKRRFPGEQIFSDVRDVTAESAPYVDVLVGGFPCQNISSAGRGEGIRGDRSGLWTEFARVIGELRPSIVLIENVAILRSRGLDVVLYDLQGLGYDAEWDIIPAAAVGAPHLRERIWIIARPTELAQEPVYGDVIGEFSAMGKKPRAGRMNSSLHALEPIAPRKTKRQDGWSYWTGVNLFADTVGRMWPTATSRDWKDEGPNVNWDAVAARSSLAGVVQCAERDHALWPTPDASVAQDGEGPGTWLARREIIKAKGINGNGMGMPLTIATQMWPSPQTRDGVSGGPQIARLTNPAYRKVNGSLNPTWVEWLMALPLWWTDPTVPTSFCTPVGWDSEPLHVAPRVALGIAMRKDRLKAIGNSCVWPCAFIALERALAVTPLPA